MRNGHKLKPLKQRLNANQQFKRREKMKRNGTWRQEMEQGVAKGFGALAYANQMNVKRAVIIQRYNLALHAAEISGIAYLVGRIVGWW
jgi:hypothetical protein